MNNIQREIARRRTFAIISHPDAGKTTLTEKLLLFGGGIQTAGAVKSNKIRKTATSDFMEIEKQRGISVATAVMTFEYSGLIINILDTPGHKDFAEDTYRTLTAVDSVILVVDCVKGVEEQTEKLMNVCRMRNTPVIIFVNKLDREGKRPFELMDELEAKLGITVRPLTWPIGMGRSFKGVYNLLERNLYLFNPGKTVVENDRSLHRGSLRSSSRPQGRSEAAQLREDPPLSTESIFPSKPTTTLEEPSPRFSSAAPSITSGEGTPRDLRRIAPPPGKRETSTRLIQPEEESFSGFVFKIHANLDPRHRDRIAFLRVCWAGSRRTVSTGMSGSKRRSASPPRTISWPRGRASSTRPFREMW
jgi:peptide chain release factor 3